MELELVNLHVFKKGYTPNCTTEIFRISQIKDVEPAIHTLKGY